MAKVIATRRMEPQHGPGRAVSMVGRDPRRASNPPGLFAWRMGHLKELLRTPSGLSKAAPQGSKNQEKAAALKARFTTLKKCLVSDFAS